METTETNMFEGIEYSPFAQRYAAYTNKWAPFPRRYFIGTYESLNEAISARKATLESQPHE